VGADYGDAVVMITKTAQPKPVNIWLLYEARKKELQRKNPSPQTYEREIKRITKELGI